MKILVPLDSHEYSRKILKDVARLARNTLADIVFLGVQDKSQDPQPSLVQTLMKYRNDVCSYFSADEQLYGDLGSENFKKLENGGWELSSKGMKEFALHIAVGSIAKQSVELAEQLGANLIILGCGGMEDCEWEGEMNVPLRIAKDASCSVLVVKQPKKSDEIVSILDQSIVSQDSLELINQMVTLHETGLKIVGVSEKKVSKQDRLETRMVELLKYYNERQIGAWVTLIDSSDVKNYVASFSGHSIVALWMGKESLIKKLFTPSMVDRLLETTKSSLLILR